MSRIIAFEDAHIGYPDGVILSDFSWVVDRGAHWAVVGSNGSGKTTLMKTLLGLLPLQGGAMTFYTTSGEQTSQLNIGYLPQINQIDRKFPITVSEVIASGLMGQTQRAEDKERLAYLLDRLGLSDKADHSLAHISGGQLQRTLLARALVCSPEVLVLDEPMSFLDKEYKRQFDRLLMELIAPECTVLMVTHDAHHGATAWEILEVD